MSKKYGLPKPPLTESRGKSHTKNNQSSAGAKESRGKSHTQNNQSSASA